MLGLSEASYFIKEILTYGQKQLSAPFRSVDSQFKEGSRLNDNMITKITF